MLLLVARSSLTVRDQGPGVPKDALQNIFSPFFRINGPGRREEGNGLGLAIALEAIRLHHGSITHANPNRGGLEFSARLPVSGPAAAKKSPPASPLQTPQITRTIS